MHWTFINAEYFWNSVHSCGCHNTRFLPSGLKLNYLCGNAKSIWFCFKFPTCSCLLWRRFQCVPGVSGNISVLYMGAVLNFMLLNDFLVWFSEKNQWPIARTKATPRVSFQSLSLGPLTAPKTIRFYIPYMIYKNIDI